MSTKLPRLATALVSSEDVSPSPLAVRECAVVRLGTGGERRSTRDHTAVEEPLQVCVDGQPFAVIMRTPGDDDDLAAGFLLAESIIATRADITSIGPVLDQHGRPRHNVIDVGLSDFARQSPRAARRTTTSAACGLCGRQQIESLTTERPPIALTWQVDADAIHALPPAVRARQHRFDATGGLHAAALFSADGTVAAVAEDVGRHNAVDKIVGARLLEDGLPLEGHGLFVSGRVAFEIVQKAALAGLGLVVAVSAPSSLAVELAQAAGITLIGFARERRFNVYSHPERIRPDARAV